MLCCISRFCGGHSTLCSANNVQNCRISFSSVLKGKPKIDHHARLLLRSSPIAFRSHLLFNNCFSDRVADTQIVLCLQRHSLFSSEVTSLVICWHVRKPVSVIKKQGYRNENVWCLNFFTALISILYNESISGSFSVTPAMVHRGCFVSLVVFAPISKSWSCFSALYKDFGFCTFFLLIFLVLLVFCIPKYWNNDGEFCKPLCILSTQFIQDI